MKRKRQRQMIRAQLYLMLQRKGFWCSLGIVMLFNLACYAENVMQALHCDIFETVRPTDYFSLTVWRDGLAVFPLIFPLLIVLPVALYVCDEEKNGLYIYSMVRADQMAYYRARQVAAWTGGALMIWIPFGADLIWSCLTFTHWETGYEGNLYSEMYFMSKDILLLDLYQKNPLAHQILYIFVLGIFAGICAVFAGAFANYLQKYKILCLVPVYLLFFCSRALQIPGYTLDDYLTWPVYMPQNRGAGIVAVAMLAASEVLIRRYAQMRKNSI